MVSQQCFTTATTSISVISPSRIISRSFLTPLPPVSSVSPSPPLPVVKEREQVVTAHPCPDMLCLFVLAVLCILVSVRNWEASRIVRQYFLLLLYKTPTEGFSNCLYKIKLLGIENDLMTDATGIDPYQPVHSHTLIGSYIIYLKSIHNGTDQCRLYSDCPDGCTRHKALLYLEYLL